MDWKHFLIPFGPTMFVLFMAILFTLVPPKKINIHYGYKTNRSMKSQATWEYANNRTAKFLRQVTLGFLILDTLIYLLLPISVSLDHINILAQCGLTLFLLYTLIMSTEKKLKERFNLK